MRHAREPWNMLPAGKAGDPPHVYSQGCIVATVDTSAPEVGERGANAGRIVGCVNACEGMENPAALRTRLDAYHCLHDGLSDMIENGRLTESDIPDDYKWLVESLAALANEVQP